MTALPPSSHPRCFLRDEKGGIAIIFSLVLIPIIGIFGIAIDFGQVLHKKNMAQMAADASSLQASSVARDTIMKGDGTALAIAKGKLAGEDAGRQMFSAYMTRHQQIGVTTPTVVVTVAGRNVTGTVDYSVQSPNQFGGVFGKQSFTAVGNAAAVTSMPLISEFHLLLDASASMGIAENNAEMVRLFKIETSLYDFSTGQKSNGKVGCVFGCHQIHSGLGIPQPTKPTAQIAKDNNIRLRIHALRDAVIAMIDQAQKKPSGGTYLRFAINKMGYDDSFQQAQALSSDFARLKEVAKEIDIPTNVSWDKIGNHTSYLNNSMRAFAASLSSGGTGQSSVDARKFAVVITDGLVSRHGPENDCKKDADHDVYLCPMTKGCADLKAKNITVAVIYTTYMPLWKNPANAGPPNEYQGDYKRSLVDTGVDKIMTSSLRNCASPGWFYEVSDGSGISEALKKIYEDASISTRLTN